MLKKIMLCGKDIGCCPSLEVDEKNSVLHIVDGEQRIILSKEHLQRLAKYLYKRGYGER